MADHVTKYKPTVSSMPVPDGWQALPFHKLATIFPEASEEDYNALTLSLQKHGFLESDPIVLIKDETSDYGYSVLDGRNRYNACSDTEITPLFVEYVGDDPVGFVTARNMDRRHLTTGQKAAVAAKLASLGMGQNKSSEADVTQAEAAKRVGVGEASLRRYKALEQENPALAEEVAKGTVTLEDARRAAAKGKTSTESKTGKLGDKRKEKIERKLNDYHAQLNDLFVETRDKLDKFEEEIYKWDDEDCDVLLTALRSAFSLGKEFNS